VTLTIRKIEEMAPDQRSLTAAAKLRKPGKWPTLATESARALAWGECQGSGANPYRVVLDTGQLGYKCTCPSRKFPCKHVLALGWMLASSPGQFAAAAAPDWVDDWLGRRKGRRRKTPADKGKPTLSATAADLAAKVEELPDDPEVAEKKRKRSEAQAARLKERRHASILEGLDAFDRWLLDLLGRGVAMALPELSTLCRQVARRLVDAKAGGLAGAVDALPSYVFKLPERERAEATVLRLGRLHLLARAYRNLDRLPEALQHDVRRLVGWTTKRTELLDDPGALRVTARWQVLAGRTVIQADALRRIETWLVGDGEDDGPRHAVLLDYHPVSAGKMAPPFSPGDSFEAELVFFRSAMPLRAVIGQQHGPTSSAAPVPAGLPLAEAVADHRARLAVQPWLGTRPLLAADVAVAVAGDRPMLTDGATTLPIDPAQLETVRPIAGMPLDVAVGLWDGDALVLAGAGTGLGRWTADGLVE